MQKLFTLFAFIVCTLAAFADEVVYDFSASVPQPWVSSVQPFGYETSGSMRGTQFNKATPEATLTLAGVKNVTKVVVTCSSNIADLNTLSVSAAGSLWGTETFAKETNVEKTFSGAAASGNLTLDITIADKSVYISKVVVTCDEAGGGTGENPDVEEPDDQDLDPDFEYPEPTVIWPTGEVSSNTAYSFVQNNIKVSATVGGQADGYFGCNAGQQITFTATQPIKALVITGYVKQGFEADCDHGDIMYVDASEDAVEATPVLAVLDVDSKSVTISCVKQMRCYVAQVYFEENPDIEGGGGEEDDDLNYDYEPTEKSNIDITFDEVQYVDYTPFFGIPYTDMYFIAEEYEMELTAYCEAVPVTMLPVGTYEINDSDEEGTVEASPGGDYNYDYPSYIATDFEYFEEYESWGYGAAYYLMSGTLTIANDPEGVKVTLDAKTYNGSTVKATFVGCPDGDEEYLDGVNTVLAPSADSNGKHFSNGRVTIRHNGKTYTTAGLRLR